MVEKPLKRFECKQLRVRAKVWRLEVVAVYLAGQFITRIAKIDKVRLRTQQAVAAGQCSLEHESREEAGELIDAEQRTRVGEVRILMLRDWSGLVPAAVEAGPRRVRRVSKSLQ